MELKKAIEERRSTRVFKKKKIPGKKLVEIIKAGCFAPSACNQQLWKFILVQNNAIKKKLVKEASCSPLIQNAPAVIAVFYKKNNVTDSWNDCMSASAAIQNMLLRAHSLGIGSCWIGHRGKIPKVKEILEAPEKEELVAFVLLGYSNEKSRTPERRKIESVYSLEKFKFSEKKMKTNAEERSLLIGQTSPSRESFPYGSKEEFNAELKILSKWLPENKKILCILPFDGTHALWLLEKKNYSLELIETSKKCMEFIKEREQFFKLGKKPAYRQVKELSGLPQKKAEFALCTQQLESLPDRKKTLKAINAALKKNSIFIVSFRNAASWHGAHHKLIGKNKKTGRFFEPVPFDKMKKEIEGAGFEIKKTEGISPLPIARGKSRSRFKRFCKIVLFYCKKK